MRPSLCVAVLLACATFAAAQKPASCPWFSSGSAQAVLGGPVLSNLQVEGNAEGSCEFASQSSGNRRTLRILAGKADTHACPPGSTQLKALGNEAMQCRRTDAQGNRWDVIAGRMRDVFFVVSMSNVPDAVAAPSAEGRAADPHSASILERVAEQVVGNLD